MTKFWQHYSLVNESEWKIEFFTPKELSQQGGSERMGQGSLLVDFDFISTIERMRKELGFPFIVNSYYRSPVYNDHISTTGLNGVHTKGRAMDLKVHHDRAYNLIIRAHKYGITGIGVSQNGDYERRFIHLDNLRSDEGVRPNIWSY